MVFQQRNTTRSIRIYSETLKPAREFERRESRLSQTLWSHVEDVDAI